MKKNILVFGANSFIAREFMAACKEEFNIKPVYRRPDESGLGLDFTQSSGIASLVQAIDFPIEGVVFFQGLNPSAGLNDISEDHFIKMMQVNIITPTLLLQSLRSKVSNGCSVIFFSSVAKRKGSYDPSYAAAKSSLTGLIQSLANALPSCRFNMISLGLVENSPVYNQMTEDFRERHASRMQNHSFIKAENITSTIRLLLENQNINRADIPVDGGYV